MRNAGSIFSIALFQSSSFNSASPHHGVSKDCSVSGASKCYWWNFTGGSMEKTWQQMIGGKRSYENKQDTFKGKHHCQNIHIIDSRLLGQLWRPGWTFWARNQLDITAGGFQHGAERHWDFFPLGVYGEGREKENNNKYFLQSLPTASITRLLLFNVIASSRVMDK